MPPDDLQIKLVLDAVNNMSGKVEGAVRDLEKVSKAMANLERHSHQSNLARSGSLLDPKTWSALAKDQEAFTDRMNRLQWSGMDKMMVGGAMLAPVVATVKAAGDLEEIMNQIKIDTYDSSISADEWARRVALLRETTVNLSRDVKYSAAEIGDAVDNLVRGNVAVEDVANGAARAAVYLAQASKGEVSTGGAADAVAKLGNAWQLTGKEIEEVADTLARVDSASTASIPSLLEGFKYVSSTASNLKIPVRDTAIALGILNNAGLEASTAGTTLNMMLQHLQPTTKVAREMFEDLGLSVENNPFYDVNGRLKPMLEIINILRRATRDMTDQQKQLAFSKIFDERGSRAVMNLLKEGKNSFEDIEGSLSRQMSLWERIRTQNQGLNAQIDILKGNLTTMLSEGGSPLGQELTSLVSKTNDLVVGMTEWSKANPEVVTGTLKTIGAIGGLTAAIGFAQLAIAAFMKIWIPFINSPLTIGAGSVLLPLYGLTKLGNALAPHIPGTAPYIERQIQEQSKAWDEAYANRSELAKIPTSLAAAPSSKRLLSPPPAYPYGPSGGVSHPLAGAGPTTIHIYTRDSKEAAQEVKRVLDQPVELKYQRSRMPIHYDAERTE